MRRLAVFAPLLPLLLGLNAELQDVDAAQYADVARRMVSTGDWLALSHSQGPFVNKPPFSMWAQAVCITLLGPTSVAARLPALLFAVLTVAAVRAIGRMLFGPREGELAGLLAASTAALHVMVIDPKVDLALTATTSCAIWAFLAARDAPRWAFAGWALTGLALLTKGPLGVAIVAAAIAPEAVRERGRLRFQPFLGPLLAAALAAPFYWTVWKVYGADNVEYLLWRQSMGRFNGSSGYVDATSPLFYVHTSAWAFLPWTPVLLVVLVRKARRLGNLRLPDWQRVPVWWFALPFAAFSVSDYKLPQYVYALTPAVALLCAPWLCEASDAAARRLRWWFDGLAAGGVLGGASALWFTAGWPIAQASVGAAAGAVGFGASAFLARRAGPVSRAVAHGAVCLLGASLVWQLWLGPLVVSFQGGAALGALAQREDPRGVELPFVETQPTHAAAYYANRTAAFRTLAEAATLVHLGQTQLAVVDPAAPPRWEDAALEATELERFPAFPTSRPSRAFLDARTRPQVLGSRAVVRLRELPVR